MDTTRRPHAQRISNCSRPGVRDSRLEVRQADGTHGSKIVYESDMRDASLEIRGNPNKLGPPVPRRFVSVLARSEGATKAWDSGSGRLDLAHSITSDSKDLVARVIVNRVWRHHFGRGLVETPSDFGRQGERPTHPELLDDLAYRFMEHDWSLKWLHREILLSATYQQARGGMAYGATDDFGFRAMQDKVHIHDLHATILHLMGLDHTKLTYRHGGRDYRLTDIAGNVVKPILA